MAVRILEVSTFANIPSYVPFGVLYLAQDTGILYIGTGSSTGPAVNQVAGGSSTLQLPSVGTTSPSPAYATSETPTVLSPALYVPQGLHPARAR